MPRQPTQSHLRDIPCRRAVVVLRNGRQYEGPTCIVDGFVHCDALRRVHEIDGVTYRQAGNRSWPRAQIREIMWSDAELEFAA